jgi:rhamnogalacturonan acetylesterase
MKTYSIFYYLPAALALSCAVLPVYAQVAMAPRAAAETQPKRTFTPPPPAPPDAYYPEQQPAAPFKATLPSIFLVGDSTASYHPDRLNEGAAAVQGWGVFMTAFFDPNKANFVNLAKGGRSTRTFMSEGLWADVLKQVKPHDIVLLQLGQNDIFPINDRIARGTIPGIGDESQEIDNAATGKHEVVHTFGWYLRKYIEDTRAKGATPIVMSLTTRDVWKDGEVEVGVNTYREDSYRVALAAGHTDFVDVSAIIATQYEKLGQEKAFGLFHTKEPVHINTAGAFLDAQCILAGLKGLPDMPVTPYLSYLGLQVTAAKPAVPAAWAQAPGDANRQGNLPAK